MSRYRVKESDGFFIAQIWRWYMPWWSDMFVIHCYSGRYSPRTFGTLDLALKAIEEFKRPKQKPIVKYHKV